MSSLRIARAALRARPAAIVRPLQRRGYAEVASDKIKLSLALPHQVRNATLTPNLRNDQLETMIGNPADAMRYSLSTSHKMCTLSPFAR